MFEYIDYMETIRECGSFTKAAEKLYITQPALSIVIKKVEDDLGTKLFVRSKKGVILTEKGELYLQAAHEAAEIEKRARDQMIPENENIKGKINIGAAGICMRYVVPGILKEFNKQYPGIKVQVTEESYYSLRDALLREDLDLMLDTESYHAEIAHARLFPNHLFYAIPVELIRNTEFLNKGLSSEAIAEEVYLHSDMHHISMQEVLDIPFLSLQPRNELYSRSEMLFSYYNCRPETLMYFNQQLTAYRFAQQGFGATFISDTLIKVQPTDRLKFYEFTYPLPERWISIGYKKDRYLTRAMSAFIDIAEHM